ncbi:hypothetical protein Tco_0190045, partial [Tanacetum coccineum]
MMANLSEDIQCVGSDTRPTMLDRTDFESWQQRIRLYRLGKDNGVNILKSIDEGPFKMGRFGETLAEGTEDAFHLGPEHDRVFVDLTPEENKRFKADIRATNDIYTLINHYTDDKYIWDNVKMLLKGSELTKDERESQLYDAFEDFRQNKGESIHEYYVRFTKLINDMRNIKMTMPKMQLNSKFVNNMLPEWGRFVTTVKLNRERYNQQAIDPLALVSNGRQNRGQGNYARGAVVAGNGGVQNRVGNANPGGKTNTFDDDVDEAPGQDLALTEDNVFQADQCDAFDSDVDEAPTAQTMFMANLSSADPIYDEVGPSYDLDILSEVQDHDNYLDSIGEYHEVHEMQNDVQSNYVVDSDAEYTSDGNIIPYEQYVKDNAVTVVQSNVSFVPNDALVMIINDMHEQSAQCVFANEQSKVVNASLTTKLARYKEQVELYKRWTRFELNEREQKINEQLRIITTDRNIKEESLKKELHSVKIKLNST